MRPIFTVQIENGRLVGADSFDKYVETRKDGRYNIEIYKPRKNKTPQQLGYYFAVVVPMFAEYYGCYDEEAHNILKSLLLRKKIVSKNDKVVETVLSLSDLDKQETIHYVDRCIRFMAIKCGVVVPPPNSVKYD